MEASTIILIALCAPSALLITFFVLYELYTLKIFKMATALIITFVTTVIALIVSGTNRRYQEARKEIE
jgi:hypothetical protein